MPVDRSIRASTVTSGSDTGSSYHGRILERRGSSRPVPRGFSLTSALARGLAPLARVGRHLAALVREDRTAALVVLGFALTELVTVLWDLPGSHGWENDGLAPRDLFAGIAHNLTPGQGHQYPLLHCLLLALVCLPVLLLATLAGPLDAAAVHERVLSIPTMTGISLLAKLVAIAMACASLLVLARIVRRTVGARAGRLAAVCGATCLTFAFYGRESNLEVPYLTSTLFAHDAVLDVRVHGDAASLRRFALLAAAAVATKDQAYAAFVLVAPLYLVLSPRCRRTRGSRTPPSPSPIAGIDPSGCRTASRNPTICVTCSTSARGSVTPLRLARRSRCR
jgi:hypothetical protein